MPNRILRDWTDSEPVNALSVYAERLFVRLIMKADDYGRLTAHPKLLRAMLFPRTFDQVREADLTRWLAECESAGLIVLYGTEAKPLLEILNFNQRTRSPSKFDAPSLNDGQMTASGGQLPAYAETYSETNAKAQAETGIADGRFDKFMAEYPKKTGRKEALAVFLKINPNDEMLGIILTALTRKRRCADWQREEGRYVPRAEKWLEDRGWEEFSPRRPAKSKDQNSPEPSPKDGKDNAEQWRRIRAAQATATAMA